LLGDSHLLEQLGQIDAARAAGSGIDIGDRARRQQRLLNASTLEMSGFGRALLDRDAMPARASALALLSTTLLRGTAPVQRRHDDHVEILAGRHALRQAGRRVVVDRHLVPGPFSPNSE